MTTDRLWRGRFTRPVGGTLPGTGFGARRIINGAPRSPHGGIDYSMPLGTPVVAANTGRVALVDEFFFPGRMVVLDHGLGLYTLYFHLDSVTVSEGERVERGQTHTSLATPPCLRLAPGLPRLSRSLPPRGRLLLRLGPRLCLRLGLGRLRRRARGRRHARRGRRHGRGRGRCGHPGLGLTERSFHRLLPVRQQLAGAGPTLPSALDERKREIRA